VWEGAEMKLFNLVCPSVENFTKTGAACFSHDLPHGFWGNRRMDLDAMHLGRFFGAFWPSHGSASKLGNGFVQDSPNRFGIARPYSVFDLLTECLSSFGPARGEQRPISPARVQDVDAGNLVFSNSVHIICSILQRSIQRHTGKKYHGFLSMTSQRCRPFLCCRSNCHTMKHICRPWLSPSALWSFCFLLFGILELNMAQLIKCVKGAK